MPATPILVTGAAGFAGSHLLDLLVTDGRSELIGWHHPDVGPKMTHPSVRWRAIDLLDASAVRQAIAELRPEVVYHCAGAAHVGSSWERVAHTLAVNVRCTHHLLDALRRARLASRVVITSSAMVYEALQEPLTERHRLLPPSPYGLSKVAQELVGRHALTDGIGVLIARAFNHFGPRQEASFMAASFAHQVADIEAGRSAPEIVVGNLEARRDLTDVRDTVRAYRAIAERGQPGRPYNVCTGHALVIREVLDGLLARARVPIRVRVDPARYQPNDRPLLLGDPSRIREELGWTPQVPLGQTLDDLLTYWRAQ